VRFAVFTSVVPIFIEFLRVGPSAATIAKRDADVVQCQAYLRSQLSTTISRFVYLSFSSLCNIRR
jgi:hypothetical protein